MSDIFRIFAPEFVKWGIISMPKEQKFIFNSPEIEDWLAVIVGIRDQYRAPNDLLISLSEEITLGNFANFHLVTLSCLIDYAKRLKGHVFFEAKNTDLQTYLLNDVRIRKYWQGDEDEVFSSPEQKPFNLWRILERYSTNYSIALNQYFERVYFDGKDLSSFNSCVAELFQNIIDHAEADGNAFFAITYKPNDKKLEIAICDFGIGIPSTLREKYPDSCDALQNSLVCGVTAGTRKHNRGFGMDNIICTLSNNDCIRIASNDAFLEKSHIEEKVSPLHYNFKGTLIYFTISTDSFEDKEFVGDLNFG